MTSRGDYYTIPSNIYILNSSDQVSKILNLPANNLTICGDSAYVVSAGFNYITQKNTISYAIVNTAQQAVVSTNFITDGTDKKITIPYGIAVNPQTKEIFVTDAKDYVTPGRLYCFSPAGKYKWDVETGDIPGHFVFTTTKLSGL